MTTMDVIGRKVVDHTFVRLAQFTAVVLIVCFVGVVLLLWIAGRIFRSQTSK